MYAPMNVIQNQGKLCAHVGYVGWADPFGRFIILIFFLIFIQWGQTLKAAAASAAVASGRSNRQWNIEINNIQRVISIYQSHCTDQQWLGDRRKYDSDHICDANKSNERCSNRQRKVHKTYTQNIHVGRSASSNYHKPQNKANEKYGTKAEKLFLFVHMRSNVMCDVVFIQTTEWIPRIPKMLLRYCQSQSDETVALEVLCGRFPCGKSRMLQTILWDRSNW